MVIETPTTYSAVSRALGEFVIRAVQSAGWGGRCRHATLGRAGRAEGGVRAVNRGNMQSLQKQYKNPPKSRSLVDVNRVCDLIGEVTGQGKGEESTNSFRKSSLAVIQKAPLQSVFPITEELPLPYQKCCENTSLWRGTSLGSSCHLEWICTH